MPVVMASTVPCWRRALYDRPQHIAICQHDASDLVDTSVHQMLTRPEQRVTHRADIRHLLISWAEPPEMVFDRADRVVDSVAGTRIVGALGAIPKGLLDGSDRTE